MASRFVLIGGFLGAGKSTTVGRLANQYVSLGKRVAIITNDQTDDLVDTHSLRNQGFEVGEVAGACFCCSFNELTQRVEEMSASELPDVILAEPVGSCTDLVATVIRPLESVFDRPLEIAPYGVILKPSHGRKILCGNGKGGFSPKAEYIFRKQIEEADFVVVNRIDELSAEEVQELCDELESQFPGRTIIRMSAKTGEGFDAYAEFLEQSGNFGTRVMEVDYDLYAEGEAELGWLNCQIKLEAQNEIALDDFLLSLVSSLQSELASGDCEVAHLKAIGMYDGNYAVANSVSSFTEPALSLESKCSTSKADIVVNARVATSPEHLEQLVRKHVEEICEQHAAKAEIESLQCFRPGRPVPTHRITTA
jgi:Ni2+-binding GTPase involved in maturation of urease and hydrogenase